MRPDSYSRPEGQLGHGLSMICLKGMTSVTKIIPTVLKW